MENENTKFVVVDMNDVIDGEAVAYATNPTETKVLSKDYASSTGQTGTKVTQSKYTTIKNYVITSYATNTSATVLF